LIIRGQSLQYLLNLHLALAHQLAPYHQQVDADKEAEEQVSEEEEDEEENSAKRKKAQYSRSTYL
jgi:hypothetical protein